MQEIFYMDFPYVNTPTIYRDDILDFIKNFQNEGTIKTFTEGCCFWFALILDEWCKCLPVRTQHRIMYNQVDGHFACEINCDLYDITGRLDYNDNWVPWADWYMSEPSYREVVVRDCILKSKK